MYGIPYYGLKLGELMFVEIISCDVNVDASIFVNLRVDIVASLRCSSQERRGRLFKSQSVGEGMS